MQSSKRIAFNTGILYIKFFLSIVIGLYTTRLILNALGQADYGIYALVGGVIGMLSFLQAAMSEASVRYIAHSMGSGELKLMNKVYNTTIQIHYIFGFVLIVLLEILGYIMFQYWLNIPSDRLADAKLVFQFMIVTAFISIISVPFDAVISSKENFLALSLIDLFGVLLTLGIAIYITYAKNDQLLLYGALMMSQKFIVRVLKQSYSRIKYKEYQVNIFQKPDKKLIKEIMAFSGWNLIAAGGIIISTQMKSIFLNMFFGVNLNAADGIAKSLSGKMNTFVTGMSKAFSPQILKNEGAGDREKMLQLIYVIARLGIFITGILAIPIIIEMPLVLKLWLKNVPEFAVIFARLIILDILIRRLTFAIPYALKAIGKIKEINIAVGLITLISIPVSYYLFKIGYPPYVIYIVTIVTSLCMGINRLYYGKKIAGISIWNYFTRVILKSIFPLSLSFLISFLTQQIMPNGTIGLLISIILSTIVSIFLVSWLGLTRTEYHQILGFAKKEIIKKFTKTPNYFI